MVEEVSRNEVGTWGRAVRRTVTVLRSILRRGPFAIFTTALIRLEESSGRSVSRML